MLSAAVSWIDEWPLGFPCRRGPWTVSDGTRWAIVEPAAARAVAGDTVGWPVVVHPADDPLLVGLAPALESGELVSYRHHRRAVVRTGTGYIKVTVPKKSEAIARRHRLAAELGVAAPVVGDHHPDGRIELDTVPGRSLFELTVDTVVASAHIVAVAEAIAGLHQHQPPTVCAYDPSPGWIDTTARAAPELAVELGRIFDLLPAVPTGGSHLIHGDLHDKNVLLDARGVEFPGAGTREWPGSSPGVRPGEWRGVLIDLDGLAIGDPAIDVGNLAAHVQLRALQGLCSHAEAERVRAELVARYQMIRVVDLDAVRIVERHTWLRLAALYHFRRSSQHLVPRLLSLAADGIES